jgi:uncharacterized membrane protein
MVALIRSVRHGPVGFPRSRYRQQKKEARVILAIGLSLLAVIYVVGIISVIVGSVRSFREGDRFDGVWFACLALFLTGVGLIACGLAQQFCGGRLGAQTQKTCSPVTEAPEERQHQNK